MNEEDYWHKAFVEAEKDKKALKQAIRRLNVYIVKLEWLSVAFTFIGFLLALVISQWSMLLSVLSFIPFILTWIWYKLV